MTLSWVGSCGLVSGLWGFPCFVSVFSGLVCMNVWANFVGDNLGKVTVPLGKTEWASITRSFYAAATKKRKLGIYDTLTVPQPEW